MSWSRRTFRMDGGAGSQTIDIPADVRGLRYLGLGPMHTAGTGFVQRADSSLQFPTPPSSRFDAPLVLTPDAPFQYEFDGPASITFGNNFPTESATVQLVHPVVDVIWSDRPLAPTRRGAMFFATSTPLTNGQTIYVPTFFRRIVKLTLCNDGAGASTTRVDLGIPDPSVAFRITGSSSRVRLFKTFAVPLTSGTTVCQWGGGYAPAPDTPLTGENGQIPAFLKIGETGASASTYVIVEAYD